MNLNHIARQTRRLIADGDLKGAAQQLVGALGSGTDRQRFSLYNQVIGQLSQLNELETAELQGVISTADADLKRNKVRSALLAIAERLENWHPEEAEKTGSSLPPAVREREPVNWKKIALAIGALVIALVTWVIVDNPFTPPLTGCYIKSSLMTDLLAEPILFGSQIGTLPNNKEYQVLDVKVVKHVGPVHFFKVRDKKLGVGWVQEGLSLSYVAPSCFDEGTNSTTKSQQEGGAGKRPESPPVVEEEETFTGCWIETGLMTGLLSQPEMPGAQIMELPKHKKYQVLAKRKIKFAGRYFWYFRVQEGSHTGWVRQIELDYTSPKCLE